MHSFYHFCICWSIFYWVHQSIQYIHTSYRIVTHRIRRTIKKKGKSKKKCSSLNRWFVQHFRVLWLLSPGTLGCFGTLNLYTIAVALCVMDNLIHSIHNILKFSHEYPNIWRFWSWLRCVLVLITTFYCIHFNENNFFCLRTICIYVYMIIFFAVVGDCALCMLDHCLVTPKL